jgi:hypothetical protein
MAQQNHPAVGNKQRLSDHHGPRKSSIATAQRSKSLSFGNESLRMADLEDP